MNLCLRTGVRYRSVRFWNLSWAPRRCTSLPPRWASWPAAVRGRPACRCKLSTACQKVFTLDAGLDNMRDPGILDPRHFFSPGTFTRFTRFLHNFTRFYMIFAQFSMIFAQFYANFAIFTRFFVIFTRFLRFLRDFCDFYANFCQAKILASQAPKTIIQACLVAKFITNASGATWWPNL